jgi:hypothetical protein
MTSCYAHRDWVLGSDVMLETPSHPVPLHAAPLHRSARQSSSCVWRNEVEVRSGLKFEAFAVPRDCAS